MAAKRPTGPMPLNPSAAGVVIRKVALMTVGPVTAFRQEVIAPWVELAGETAACRELPFGLGRQPLAGPFRICLGIVERDVHDRVALQVPRSLFGPSGWRQLVPGTYSHQRSALSSGTGCGGAAKMTEPATSFSRGTPGKSSARGVRSATVTSPVAFTNAANAAFVTSVASIQNGSTNTRWIGRESVVCFIPTASIAGGVAAPIENSPPGIQTIPFGAAPGGVVTTGWWVRILSAGSRRRRRPPAGRRVDAVVTAGPLKSHARPATPTATHGEPNRPRERLPADRSAVHDAHEPLQSALGWAFAPGRITLLVAIEDELDHSESHRGQVVLRYLSGMNASPLLAFIGMTSWFAPAS